jgi:hypothetical protein
MAALFHISRVKNMKIIISVILFLSLIMIYASWSGLFKKVSVDTTTRGPFYLVYDNQDGSYWGLRAKSRDLTARLEKEFGIQPIARIIAYHDDPRITPKQDLRALYGCLVSAADSETLSMKNAPFRMKRWPEHTFKRVTFPLSTMLSVWIGEMKAYPAIDDYNRTRGEYCGTVMEIHDGKSRVIEYLQPLEKEGEVSNILNGGKSGKQPHR